MIHLKLCIIVTMMLTLTVGARLMTTVDHRIIKREGAGTSNRTFAPLGKLYPFESSDNATKGFEVEARSRSSKAQLQHRNLRGLVQLMPPPPPPSPRSGRPVGRNQGSVARDGRRRFRYYNPGSRGPQKPKPQDSFGGSLARWFFADDSEEEQDVKPRKIIARYSPPSTYQNFPPYWSPPPLPPPPPSRPKFNSFPRPQKGRAVVHRPVPDNSIGPLSTGVHPVSGGLHPGAAGLHAGSLGLHSPNAVKFVKKECNACNSVPWTPILKPSTSHGSYSGQTSYGVPTIEVHHDTTAYASNNQDAIATGSQQHLLGTSTHLQQALGSSQQSFSVKQPHSLGSSQQTQSFGVKQPHSLGSTHLQHSISSNQQQHSIGSTHLQHSISSNQQQHSIGSTHLQHSITPNQQQHSIGSDHQQHSVASTHLQQSFSSGVATQSSPAPAIEHSPDSTIPESFGLPLGNIPTAHGLLPPINQVKVNPPSFPSPSQSSLLGAGPTSSYLQPIPFPELSSVPVLPLHNPNPFVQVDLDTQDLVPPVPPQKSVSNVIFTISEQGSSPVLDNHISQTTGFAQHGDQHSEQTSSINTHIFPHSLHGHFNGNFVPRPSLQHSSLDIVKSVPVAEFTSSIEYPLQYIQSPYIDITTYPNATKPEPIPTYEKESQTGSQKISDLLFGLVKDSSSKNSFGGSNDSAISGSKITEHTSQKSNFYLPTLPPPLASTNNFSGSTQLHQQDSQIYQLQQGSAGREIYQQPSISTQLHQQDSQIYQQSTQLQEGSASREIYQQSPGSNQIYQQGSGNGQIYQSTQLYQQGTVSGGPQQGTGSTQLYQQSSVNGQSLQQAAESPRFHQGPGTGQDYHESSQLDFVGSNVVNVPSVAAWSSVHFSGENDGPPFGQASGHETKLEPLSPGLFSDPTSNSWLISAQSNVAPQWILPVSNSPSVPYPLLPEEEGIASAVNGELTPTSTSPPLQNGSKNNKIQIIIPYTTNKDQNALESVDRAPAVVNATALPPVSTPSTQQPNNQGRKVFGQRNQPKITEFTVSKNITETSKYLNDIHHILALNIKDLLKEEVEGPKPEQNIRLQKNIDNWTALEYSNHKTVAKKEPLDVISYANAVTSIPGTSISHLLLTSKKIPDKYLTTTPLPNFDEPITTHFTASSLSVASKPFTTKAYDTSGLYSTVTRNAPVATTHRPTRNATFETDQSKNHRNGYTEVVKTKTNTWAKLNENLVLPENVSNKPFEPTPVTWPVLGKDERVYVVTPVSSWQSSSSTTDSNKRTTRQVFITEKPEVRSTQRANRTVLFGNKTERAKISKFNKPKPIEKFFATTKPTPTRNLTKVEVVNEEKKSDEGKKSINDVFPFRNGGELPLELAAASAGTSDENNNVQSFHRSKGLVKQVKINKNVKKASPRISTEEDDNSTETITTPTTLPPGNAATKANEQILGASTNTKTGAGSNENRYKPEVQAGQTIPATKEAAPTLPPGIFGETKRVHGTRDEGDSSQDLASLNETITLLKEYLEEISNESPEEKTETAETSKHVVRP